MKLDDGVLTLHQSDIGHYIMCPEQFRVVNDIGPYAEVPDSDPIRVETDAASIGTCLHAVIEKDLSDPFTNFPEMLGWGSNRFGQMIQQYVDDGFEYRSETYGGDPARTLGALQMLIKSWYNSDERMYWMQRDRSSYIVEEYFNVHFVSRPEGKTIREIRLAGTPDIIDVQENRVVDWKSASRSYQRWEKQRWAVQPTCYTYAAADQGYIKPNSDGLYKFEYKVFERKNKQVQAQTVDVWRSQGQWAWLTKLVNNLADMVESDAECWPLRDDHALCGPKWCPIWYDCKGSFVDEDWY